MYQEFRTKLGEEELIIGTGKLAKQAHGSVTVQYGGTMVLVTVVCSKKANDRFDFFPLTVEYREKTFASGRIPGGFFKREGRSTEKETLTSRMIDRPIRPLFPDGMKNEVQIIATVLSSDGKNDSDILAIIGASAALSISDIPFNGPIAGVRVGSVNGQLIVNPTFDQIDESDFELIVVGSKDNVVMLECGAREVDEDKILEAIKFGHENIKGMMDVQEELVKKLGKAKRTDISFVKLDEEFYADIKSKAEEKLTKVLQIKEKADRIEGINALIAELDEQLNPEGEDALSSDIHKAIDALEKDIVRDFILNKGKRIDGRKLDEIRKISCETNILPRTHGSGLFTRGETQALAVTTLGTSSDQQRIETLQGEGVKSFMLHYNFPPFSVGETKPMRGPGRREIGHGALAEKAFKPVLPDDEKFPYTIRIVSEILESNGSSSMATVCATSLALMGSGVPVSAAVSGIAMGLITDGDKYKVLTDIAGAEDHCGDMDFKVAGTRDGVTAVQLDMKVEGIGYEVLADGFKQAKKARFEILDKMEAVIKEPVDDISPEAPRIVSMQIKAAKIKDVIGSGGKVIRKIIAECGVDINIEDDGTCQVASADKESLDKAVKWIEGILEEPEIGKEYTAKVTKIMNFGAFCEYLPGQEGLVHVSEMANTFVKDANDIVKEGQEVFVKLVGIDDQNRVKLSIKQSEKNKDKDKA